MDEQGVSVYELTTALRIAVDEADGWHDDCVGGKIERPEFDAVRAVLQRAEAEMSAVSDYAVEEEFTTFRDVLDWAKVRVRSLFGCKAEPDNPWRDAVDEFLIVACLSPIREGEHPEHALGRLLQWETMIALDPAVSTQAQALVERGKSESEAEVKRLKAQVEELRARVRELP